MSRKILVQGTKTFVLEIPDDTKVTFGPFSPPRKGREFSDSKSLIGTLRVYKGAATTQNILALYTGVESFRDLSISYAEHPTLPICSFCKSNLILPGEDLCATCSGHKDDDEIKLEF